jgi:hypothetical protein
MTETTKTPADASLAAKPRLNEMTEEYLTIKEVAARLKQTPKTIRNKMAAGIFRKGTHYFSPEGSRPLFKWSSVVAWLEAPQEKQTQAEADLIPMARKYNLGGDYKRTEHTP